MDGKLIMVTSASLLVSIRCLLGGLPLLLGALKNKSASSSRLSVLAKLLLERITGTVLVAEMGE